METILPNLDNYRKYKKTNRCYLDGRYFNLVFSKYPGLQKDPIHIKYILEDGLMITKINYNKIKMVEKYYNIVRVIIETNNNKHSGVCIINPMTKEIYYFDSAKIDKNSKNIIKNTLKNIFQQKINIIDFDIITEKNNKCVKSGFCVAYSIKYVYDFLLNREHTFDNIRSFSQKIINYYPSLDISNCDIEYGLGGTLFGALGGGVLGGLVGGSGGALIGAGLGGLGGYALTKNNNNNNIQQELERRQIQQQREIQQLQKMQQLQQIQQNRNIIKY